MTPDGMPIIGPVTALAGLFVLAGFSGHGFQHSPAAGRLLADLVVGADPQFDMTPFALERFAAGLRPGEGRDLLVR
jgi:sarcosine oxidase subunit beta